MRAPDIPTIAVVIAARNAADFLEAALASLEAQTRPADEVIIYDDGSSDGTAGMARAFADRIKGLRVVEGETSLGIAAARNRANSMVTADFIAVLDADDLFHPETIERYGEFLSGNPGADLLYADTQVFRTSTTQGRRRCYPRFKNNRSAIRRTLGSPLLPFKHSSMVYRRTAMAAVGGYDETLPIKVDIDLFLRFCSVRRVIAKLDWPASFHRRHSQQISARRLKGLTIYRRLARRYEPNPFVRTLLLSTRIPAELLKLLVRN